LIAYQRITGIAPYRKLTLCKLPVCPFDVRATSRLKGRQQDKNDDDKQSDYYTQPSGYDSKRVAGLTVRMNSIIGSGRARERFTRQDPGFFENDIQALQLCGCKDQRRLRVSKNSNLDGRITLVFIQGKFIPKQFRFQDKSNPLDFIGAISDQCIKPLKFNRLNRNVQLQSRFWVLTVDPEGFELDEESAPRSSARMTELIFSVAFIGQYQRRVDRYLTDLLELADRSTVQLERGEHLGQHTSTAKRFLLAKAYFL
jgi:hypothetical protein